MTVSPAALLLALLAVTVLVAGSQAWLLALAKLVVTRRWLSQPASESLAGALQAVGVSPALPLVRFVPRRPVPWGLFDLIAIFGIWVIGSLAGTLVLRQLGWLHAVKDAAELTLDEQQTFIAANLAISLLILVIGLPLISWRAGARALDFGWSLADFASDLRLGLIGFAMLAPPVYMLQGLLEQFWQPSKHPLVEMFKASPDPAFFALLFVSAAIVAPLFEELVFRVLLQGFLEMAFEYGGSGYELFLGAGHRQFGQVLPLESEVSAVPTGIDLNPYASPQTIPTEFTAVKAPEPQPEQTELRGPAAWLPIAISSIIFALMHYSHGPDWIPLTLLAAGMGYLYQRTHRLLPSLAIHILINCSSMLALWVQVYDVKG